MIKKILCLFFLINLLNISYAKTSIDNCHPSISQTQENYLVGYGSLMNAESRSKTNPDVDVLIPVKIQGFMRDWSAITPGYKIIYLGATPCNSVQKQCFLNGLAYLVKNIEENDAREAVYCRKEVKYEQLQPYTKEFTLNPTAKYWIYVTKKQDIYHPDENHPLVQSYVDLFIGGCIEQAAKIANKNVNNMIFPNDYGFVFDCIKGTKGWTTNFWVNDRVYPERPWAASPYALKIDKILDKSYQDKIITGKYNYMDIPLQ